VLTFEKTQMNHGKNRIWYLLKIKIKPSLLFVTIDFFSVETNENRIMKIQQKRYY
jgi:hypothetical protein